MDENKQPDKTRLHDLNNLISWQEELRSAGYDVVPYINSEEAPGSLSYMILDPSSVEVTGVEEGSISRSGESYAPKDKGVASLAEEARGMFPEPRPDPIILSTSAELERQAAKLGEKLAPFSSAFTDLKGQTYLLPRNITDNLGIDRAIYEAHEKAVPAARILQETDLGAYEQIVEAVERGDVEAVQPGTLDYYNRIKDTPGLNRASIEE